LPCLVFQKPEGWKRGKDSFHEWRLKLEKIVINRIVKNGVVIPEIGAELPEGLRVEIVFASPAMTLELRTEFEAWDRIGDEAWAMIDQWEQEERT